MKNNISYLILDKMDLKKKIDDFRQLQAHRKSLKKCNIEIKMSFNARVKIEQGLPTFAAVITFTQASAISIIETNKPNGFHRRALHILKEEVETYDSADNTLEINYQVDVAKQDPLIIFDSTNERKSFEVSFRTFMEYR